METGIFSLFVADIMIQTETLREFEHLRYIPIVILGPSIQRINCKLPPFVNGLFSYLVFPVKWCLDNSISSQVTTPVSMQDLSSALIAALESNTVSPVSAPNDTIYDILLAEDNMVNQKLAVKILEKYGHTVEIAENGSLAVDAFKGRISQRRPFDIILVSFTHLQKTRN